MHVGDLSLNAIRYEFINILIVFTNDHDHGDAGSDPSAWWDYAIVDVDYNSVLLPCIKLQKQTSGKRRRTLQDHKTNLSNCNLGRVANHVGCAMRRRLEQPKTWTQLQK